MHVFVIASYPHSVQELIVDGGVALDLAVGLHLVEYTQHQLLKTNMHD